MVLLVFLDGLFPCVCFHLLLCVWAVLGVTLVRYWNWVVSECEWCVLVLEVCVCKLCLEREREKMKQREADSVCLMCALAFSREGQCTLSLVGQDLSPVAH